MRYTAVFFVALAIGLSGCFRSNDILEISYLDPYMTFMVMNTCRNFDMLVSQEQIKTKVISDKKVLSFVHRQLNELIRKGDGPNTVEPEAHAKAVLILQSDTIEFCYGLTECFVVGGRTVCDTTLHRFMFELTWDEQY